MHTTEKKSYLKCVQMSNESNLKATSNYMLFYVFIQLIYSIGDIF